MSHLAILLHADTSVANAYRRALSQRVDAAVDFRIVNSPHSGLSAAYYALAAELRQRSGSLLDALAARAEAEPLDSYHSVTIASFSAGYALVKKLLAERESARRINAIVAIDSFHTPLERDRSAMDSELAGLVAYGLRAREGDALLWFAHTDVRTPQQGAGAFASTTQVAAELRRLTNLSHAAGARRGTWHAGARAVGDFLELGGLRVAAVDLHARDHSEHVAALSDWGDEWLRDAVATMLSMRRAQQHAPVREPHTLPDEPLGSRALAIARRQQEMAVREISGALHHPQILEYFAGCVRHGRNIGAALQADEYPWCAAGLSYCASVAAVDGETIPHRWRAAVRELWEDAIASGSAVGAARLRRGDHTPQLGDVWIRTRGGPAFGEGAAAFAKTAGKGHTGRIASWSGDRGTTLDGNVGDAWSDVQVTLADPRLVGVIAYPQTLTPVAVAPTDEELEALDWLEAGRLLNLSRRVWRGEGGMKAVQRLLDQQIHL